MAATKPESKGDLNYPSCSLPSRQQREESSVVSKVSSSSSSSSTPLQPYMHIQCSHHLPGYPLIQLAEKRQLLLFLNKALYATDLEYMAPWLWIMTTHDSTRISPLHRQEIEGRKIIITEEARLHLVWYYDRIFVKPLPEYLLSQNVWLDVLQAVEKDDRDRLQRAARGYLRTYVHLIVHQSDFRIAQELHLVSNDLTWDAFCAFAIDLRKTRDTDVSGRYEYGEIRLTRLNFYSKFFLSRFHYHTVNAQYGAYFAQFHGPVIFTFGSCSIVLSAIQNILSFRQLESLDQKSIQLRLCRGFSIWSLVFVFSLMTFLILLLAYKIIREWDFTLKRRFRYKKSLV